jgi:Na+/H+ antiporter NhaD/arsenite permease-like protein
MPVEPHPLIMLPFAALLLAIAFAPLLLKHHWEKHYRKLCLVLAGITCGYYLFFLRAGGRVVTAGLDYASFIVIVGGFFVVAGGIHLQLRVQPTPLFNTLFLLAGAIVGNLLGTVAASMLLIRPWLRINENRFRSIHTVFFIIVVANLGGILLPTGPPLLLGYLKSVPFLWSAQRCWLPWTVVLACVLLLYYILERRTAPPAAPPPANEPGWRCFGAANFGTMIVMLAALIAAPAGWRELIILLAAASSFFLGDPETRHRNEFLFAPLVEVAWLFFGIFGTMIPILDFMEHHAARLGLRSDTQFFWTTGTLSAVLDNAPAYLTFLAGAMGLHGLSIGKSADVSQFVNGHDHYLVAISLGATCFGALTYLGNGPNLLIKAIIDHRGLTTPSFFGYVFKFALPILLPALVLLSLLFFRGG